MRNSYEKLSPKTRTRNLHEIEHALFDVRNSCEKYLAASQWHTYKFLARVNSYEFLVRVSCALVSGVFLWCMVNMLIGSCGACVVRTGWKSRHQTLMTKASITLHYLSYLFRCLNKMYVTSISLFAVVSLNSSVSWDREINSFGPYNNTK